jgi:hypothetical protein
MERYQSRAPSLPIPSYEYSHKQQDQFQNVLRLYFNQLDSFNLNVTVPNSGTSANRPTERLLVGEVYFDTTLGQPIWWNGNYWINAIGEPIIEITGLKSRVRIGTVTVTTV